MAEFKERDYTEDNIQEMKSLLHYLEYAQGRGDKAYIRTTSVDKEVVIKINLKKDKQDGPRL